MLRSVKRLEHTHVGAVDGDLGRVHELYFDDHDWKVRHVVVTVGGWLAPHRVLVSPASLRTVERELRVGQARADVARGPGIERDPPVSEQRRIAAYRYFGFPYDWPGPLRLEGALAGNPHLRSTREVIGYHVHALDGECGHVDDFLVDDASWAIRYTVVDLRAWWPGQRVLVAVGWTSWVSWGAATVWVDLEQARIREAPAYDPTRPVGPAEEPALLVDPALSSTGGDRLSGRRSP